MPAAAALAPGAPEHWTCSQHEQTLPVGEKQTIFHASVQSSVLQLQLTNQKWLSSSGTLVAVHCSAAFATPVTASRCSQASPLTLSTSK
jgi:hypothetical protein